MELTLDQSYEEQVDPVKQCRDEKLQFAICKLTSQGRLPYLDACSQIVHPFQIAGHLGIGDISSIELQECAAEEFSKLVHCLKKQFISLHLCKGRGFIHRTQYWCRKLSIPKPKWISVVDSDCAVFDPELLQSGQIISGEDITRDETVNRVIEHTRDMNILFITGEIDDKSPENAIFPVIMNQIFVSLEVLADGGLLVIKIQEFYQHETKLVLWLLYNVFQKVSITKPKTSACSNNSKYVVCSCFRRSVYVQKYQETCAKIRKTNNTLLLEFPLGWSHWLTDKQNQYTLIKEKWITKSLHTCNILLTEAPYLSQKELDMLVGICWKDANIRQFMNSFINRIFLDNI